MTAIVRAAEMQLRFDDLRSVLCIGAHPDDIEIGCGGTLLQLLSAIPELRVHWVVLSGDTVRQREATTSFHDYCGHGEQHQLHLFAFRDRFFPTQWQEVKTELHRLAEDIRPQLVFTHHRHDAHQDHRVVAELTGNAFREQIALEYEIAKYDGDLGKPNVFVPIGTQTVERKIQGLLHHFASQRARPWFDREAFSGLMRLRGLESNSPTRFAEAFHGQKLVVDVS